MKSYSEDSRQGKKKIGKDVVIRKTTFVMTQIKHLLLRELPVILY